MTSHSDLELLKEIPGYKAILKSVLKSQIQLLIEQLADHTGEESIILTASVNDGALSHLGSSTGKGFLEGRDEIKSQFLGYCLKTHHTRKSEQSSSPYQRDKPLMPSHTSKRPRIRQVPYPMSPSGHHSHITSSTSHVRSGTTDVNSYSQNSGMNLDSDAVNQSDSYLDKVSMPDSVGISHPQTGNQSETDTFGDLSHQETADENGSLAVVKSEPGNQEDPDLEVTGVELGDNSLSSENWSQGYGSKDENTVEGEQSGYNASHQRQPPVTTFTTSYSATHFQRSLSSSSQSASYLPVSQQQANSNYTAKIEYDIQSLPAEMLVSSSHYLCSKCNLDFLTKTEFMNHQYDVHKLKYKECDICQKKFRNNQHLEAHRRTHTGEKPFRCAVCDKRFTAFSGLAYHRSKEGHA